MMRRTGIMVILFVTAFTSCNKRHVPVLPVSHTTGSEVRTQYILREVPQPVDSSYIKAFLRCDSLGSVYLSVIEQMQGERVLQSVTLKNNQVTVTAKDRAVKTSETNARDSVRYEYKEIPVPYPVVEYVNRLSMWQGFQIWTGRLLAGFVLVYSVIKKRFNLF